MNPFDQRWQTLVAEAREADSIARAELPSHFTQRVLARSQYQVGEGWLDLVLALAPRAVIAAACVCLLSAALAAAQSYDPKLGRPVLEKTILRELPWP